MKDEWKELWVSEVNILDGEPDSCLECPIALAMNEELEKLGIYKKYRTHIGGSKSMKLENYDEEEAPHLYVDIFEKDRQDVDEFISEFDSTHDETYPLPLPMRFRYRIVDKKEGK